MLFAFDSLLSDLPRYRPSFGMFFIPWLSFFVSINFPHSHGSDFQFQLCSGLSCTWEEHLARGVKMLQASPMPHRAVCSCVFQILHTSEMNTSCLRCRILTDKTMEERIIHTVDQQHIGVVMAPLTCYLKINQHKPSIGIRHGYSDRSSFATKRLLST